MAKKHFTRDTNKAPSNGHKAQITRPVFTLVQDFISRDTVDCLEELLAWAKSGRLIGIAFAALLTEKEFITDTAGECRRNPVFARGLVASLDDSLREIIEGPQEAHHD